jgi:hypothetical protein
MITNVPFLHRPIVQGFAADFRPKPFSAATRVMKHCKFFVHWKGWIGNCIDKLLAIFKISLLFIIFATESQRHKYTKE